MKGPQTIGSLTPNPLEEFTPPKDRKPCSLTLCLKFFAEISETSLFEGIRYSKPKRRFVFDGGASSQGLSGTATYFGAKVWQWAKGVETPTCADLGENLMFVMEQASSTLLSDPHDLNVLAQMTFALLGNSCQGGLRLLINRVSKKMPEPVAASLKEIYEIFLQNVLNCVPKIEKDSPVTIDTLHYRVIKLLTDSTPTLERKVLTVLNYFLKTPRDTDAPHDKILTKFERLAERITCYRKRLESEGLNPLTQLRLVILSSRLNASSEEIKGALGKITAPDLMTRVERVRQTIRYHQLELARQIDGFHPIDPMYFTEVEWKWYATLQHYHTVEKVGTQKYLYHVGEWAINQLLTTVGWEDRCNIIYDKTNTTPLFVQGALPTQLNLHSSDTFVNGLNTFLESQKIPPIETGLGTVDKFEIDDQGLVNRSVRPDEWDQEGVLYLHQPAATTVIKLHTIVSFLNFCVRNRKLCYVHCKGGRGRSTQAIILYLVWSGSFTTLTDALKHVQSFRKQANIKATDPKWSLAIEYCAKYIPHYDPTPDLQKMPPGESRLLEAKIKKVFQFRPQ